MCAQVSPLYEKYGVRQLRLPRTANQFIQIRAIPDKGRGLFLNHASDIPAGTLISTEQALLYRFTDVSYRNESRDSINRRIEGLLWTMSVEDQQKYIQLTCKNIDDEYGRVETNCFAEETQASPGNCSVWWLSSFFNHSCVPNCDILSDKGVMTIKTIQPVRVGEELTLSYLAHSHLVLSADDRELNLQQWSFDCDCGACCGANKWLHDANRLRINQLLTKLCFSNAVTYLRNRVTMNESSRLEAEELITLAHGSGLRFLLANAHTRAIEAWSLCDNERGDAMMQHHQAELIKERKIYEDIADPDLNGVCLGSDELAQANDVAEMRTICDQNVRRSGKRSSEEVEDAKDQGDAKKTKT